MAGMQTTPTLHCEGRAAAARITPWSGKKICNAVSCHFTTTRREQNQTLIFSMFAIFAVTGATFALRPFRMYGFTACGSSAHCTCSCQQLRQKGFTAYGGLRETMDHHLTLSAAANN